MSSKQAAPKSQIMFPAPEFNDLDPGEGQSGEAAIRVSGVSKRYRIYNHPSERLLEPLHSRFRRFLRRQPHPFREFSALEDISFEVAKGETVGIVGPNGSGKSTLLQIICGTLSPSSGTIEVRGRVAALLELGAGFNPDFTGRENVVLNASVLGMTRKQIAERFDSIEAFADIGDHMNQPVKTYSSGMVVRLAFAVQVHVEPDVLIVDEALAVGDALFQKRCYQQIERLVSDGVTLLFVSHDQEAVRTLTHRAILLNHGKQVSMGSSAETLLEYRRLLHEDEKRYLRRYTTFLGQKSVPRKDPKTSSKADDRFAFGDYDAEIQDVAVLGEDGQSKGLFYPGELIRIHVSCQVNTAVRHLNVAVRIRSKEGIKVYSWGTLNQDISIWSGSTTGDVFWDRVFEAGERFTVELEFRCTLGLNLYEIQAAVSEEEDRFYQAQRILHWRDEAAFFQVLVNPRDYFFGGIADLRMTARLIDG